MYPSLSLTIIGCISDREEHNFRTEFCIVSCFVLTICSHVSSFYLPANSKSIISFISSPVCAVSSCLRCEKQFIDEVCLFIFMLESGQGNVTVLSGSSEFGGNWTLKNMFTVDG